MKKLKWFRLSIMFIAVQLVFIPIGCGKKHLPEEEITANDKKHIRQCFDNLTKFFRDNPEIKDGTEFFTFQYVSFKYLHIYEGYYNQDKSIAFVFVETEDTLKGIYSVNGCALIVLWENNRKRLCIYPASLFRYSDNELKRSVKDLKMMFKNELAECILFEERFAANIGEENFWNTCLYFRKMPDSSYYFQNFYQTASSSGVNNPPGYKRLQYPFYNIDTNENSDRQSTDLLKRKKSDEH